MGTLPRTGAEGLHLCLFHLPLILTQAEPLPISKEEEEQEEDIPLPLHFSSSTPDEAIMPPPPLAADDFRNFQELFLRISDTLQIVLEEEKDQ